MKKITLDATNQYYYDLEGADFFMIDLNQNIEENILESREYEDCLIEKAIPISFFVIKHFKNHKETLKMKSFKDY